MKGKQLFGAVILNRVKNSKFPNTIAGVIYEKGAFTAVADGQINVPIKEGSTVLKAAQDAMNGWDPTNGCIYYFNPDTATNKWIWSRPLVKKIGKHRFCKQGLEVRGWILEVRFRKDFLEKLLKI